jgi:hypothetical protein
LAKLIKIQDTLRPRQFRSHKNDMQITIDTWGKEIEEYENSKTQQTPIAVIQKPWNVSAIVMYINSKF